MKSLNLPTYSFKIKSENQKQFIFDSQRRKFVVLTPEEWVRQHFVRFLTEEKDYPAGRIALEKSLKYNGMKKRCDILVYHEQGQPLLLIECKAPNVKITPSVFDQAAVYNLTFNVSYLIVTNGLSHYCAYIDPVVKSVQFLKDIPEYGAISS